MPESVSDFAARVKSKFSDYANVPDAELVERVLTKHPDYMSQVDLPDLPGGTLKLRIQSALSGKAIPQTQFEAARDPKNFKGGQFLSDIGGFLKPSAMNPYPGMGQEQKGQAFEEAKQRDMERKQAGRSALYRAYAPLPESLGANVSGMEQESDVGNVGGVLQHASAPIAATVAAEAAPRVFRGTRTAARVGTQEIAGAGREPVLAAERVRQAKVQGAEETHAAQVQGAEEANTVAREAHAAKTKELLDTHQQKLAEAKADYERAVTEHQQATAESKAGYADKVARLRRDWVEKAHAAEKAADEAQAISNRHETLERGQQAQAQRIADNVQQVHTKVRGTLDQRWDALRQAIGKESPTDASSVHNAVQTAIKEDLRGSPQNVKVFTDLMREIGMKDFVEGDEGGLSAAPTADATIPWETQRVHSSAVGEKLAGGNLPGNVYRALKRVHEAQEASLQQAATRAGKGAEYEALKRDWRQYMTDWHDTGSLSTGGSPLAKVMQARDPGFVSQIVKGKAGERLAATLSKYRQFGARPEGTINLRRMAKQQTELPTVKVPARPKRLELPSPPKEAAPPEMRQVKPPRLPPLPRERVAPPMKEFPPVDPKQVRLRKLEEAAGRPFRWYDLFPPYLAEHILLKSPKFREWIASQPRNELPPPPAR